MDVFQNPAWRADVPVRRVTVIHVARLRRWKHPVARARGTGWKTRPAGTPLFSPLMLSKINGRFL